jgi:hypothetical protein
MTEVAQFLILFVLATSVMIFGSALSMFVRHGDVKAGMLSLLGGAFALALMFFIR